MQSTPVDWTFVLAAAALALGLIPLGRLVFKINLNAALFAQAVRKLVDADNLDRAIKLSSAAPAAPLARGIRGVLEAYRDGIRDSMALKESFELSAGGLKTSIGKLTWLSYVGLALFLAGLFLTATRGLVPDPEQIGLDLGAFLVCYLGISKTSRIRQAAEKTRDETINFLLDRALLE